MKKFLSAIIGCLFLFSNLAGAQIVNNNSILYKGQIGVIPLVGSHSLSGNYAPVLVDNNGILQTIDVDSALYQPAATTRVVNSLAKVFITAGDGKPVQGAPIVGVDSNGTYRAIATDGLGRLILTAPAGTGIDSLNNLNDAAQVFATASTGTDFTISSDAGTHTFSIPSASASARGLVTTGSQTFAGAKTFSTTPTFSALSTGVLHADSDGILTSSAIVNADVAANAAIAFSKLAPLSSANILVGSASNVATSVTMSGDVTLDNTGAASLAATLAGNKTFSNNVVVNGTTTLNGVTSIAAAMNIKPTIVTSTPFTLNGTHNVILSNSASNITFNLPDCSSLEGRTYIIKNINTGSAIITPATGQKIDGMNTKTIATRYSSMNIVCASSNWYIY